MYPRTLLGLWGSFRIALPVACTISTLLFLGDMNATMSTAGRSTPSVRQRALEITE